MGRRVAVIAALFATLSGGLLAGCTSLLDVQQPQGTVDSTLINSYAGAVGLYGGALRQLAGSYAGTGGSAPTFQAVDNLVLLSGLLTDELHVSTQTVYMNQLDARILSPSVTASGLYAELQALRVQTLRAIQLLRLYPAQSPNALIGHMFAVEGYAELLLAESFCSGIPLTTVPALGGNVSYTNGKATTEVLSHAVAHFDSALTWSTDSARIMTLARVGKGRALLDLGNFAGAATAVSAVATADVYNVEYGGSTQSVRNGVLLASAGLNTVDGEGANGLAWRSAQDPRATFIASGTNWYATKYASETSPVPLASGIEARLIEAEAQLHEQSATWLTTLNMLRTDGSYTVTGTDTVWHAGTGGVAGLRLLDDPGTDTGRVSLLFRERAFWLFLTGHRQSDLRRLIRQYGRSSLTTFPIGLYAPSSSVAPAYGTGVVFPVPDAEAQNNHLYTGCLDLHA